MRDVDIMAATMRRIEGCGGGFAHRLQACPRAFVWLAGSVPLNAQAVSDLIADGWLSNPAGTDHAHIVARPPFAGEIGTSTETTDGCQFSCVVDVGSVESAEHADAIRGELAAELDRHEGAALGFEMGIDHETGPGALWIHADESGEPEHATRFVLRCAEAFDLEGAWGFCWSLTCSKPRIEGFGTFPVRAFATL